MKRNANEAPLRVAMLVHNAVLSDARILKEARTLWKAGYSVAIHGISPSGSTEQAVVTGTDITVFLSPRTFPRSRILILAALGLSAGWFTLMGFWIARAAYSEAVLLAVLFLVNFVSLIGLYLLRRLVYAWLREMKNFVLRNITRPLGVVVSNESYRSIAKTLYNSVVKRPPPDVIHIHDHVALAAAKALKERFTVPIIWDAHEIYEDLAGTDPVRSRVNAAIIADNQAMVDGFVTINNSIADFYEKKYAHLNDPTIVMNATMVEPLPKYDGRLHEAARIPRDQKVLLFQGGFAPNRGLDKLVRAAPLLEPNWTVILMGWGNLEGELRELARANTPRQGAQAIVFLPGVPQHELQAWSAGASLGAIPYENTGLNHLYCTPNKIWEYPNALVPILATDLIEMGALIKENEIGFLLPRQFDEHDIARIVNAISDEELHRMRRNCESFIQINNWETYAPRLLELYEMISDNRVAGENRPQIQRQAVEQAAC